MPSEKDCQSLFSQDTIFHVSTGKCGTSVISISILKEQNLEM
jgi:hypothetical protein